VRNGASAGEAVWAKISKAAETQFSVTITESKGMCAETNPGINWGSSSGGDFRVGRDSLSVMISESTETVCADQSGHQMWRQSR
jgi:hypothetical protein